MSGHTFAIGNCSLYKFSLICNICDCTFLLLRKYTKIALHCVGFCYRGHKASRIQNTGQEQCGQCSSVGGNKDTMWRMIGAGVLTRTRSFDIIVIFILETMQKCWFILIYCVHCVYVVLSKQHLLYALALKIHVIFFSVCNLVPILPIFVQYTDQQLIKI